MGVLAKILPLVFLMALGFALQRLHFFEEVSFKRFQSFMMRVTIPCLLFTAFANMEFGRGQLIVSAGMFLFMLIMLMLGALFYRVLPIKHDFFIFFFSAFGFGTVGFPVFVEIFGMENATPMALLGMGHEIFIAGVLIPAVHVYYSKGGVKFNAFFSSTMIMVALGAVIGIGNFFPMIAGNIVGAGLLETISRVGGMTLPIALILTGYRLKLSDRRYLKISAIYAAVRLVVAISVGVPFKLLFFDTLAPSFPLLDHAFYTFILQHGPIVLLVYIGQHRPIEEQIIANNAFVLHMAAGVALLFVYMLAFL